MAAARVSCRRSRSLSPRVLGGNEETATAGAALWTQRAGERAGARGVARAPHPNPTANFWAQSGRVTSGGVGTGPQGELRYVFSKSKEVLTPCTWAPLSFPARGAGRSGRSFGDGCAGRVVRLSPHFPPWWLQARTPLRHPGSCHPYGSPRKPSSLVFFNLFRSSTFVFVVVRKYPQLKAI